MQHNIFESHSGWLKFGSNQEMVNEVNLSRYCFAENDFNWPVSTIYVITLKCKSYSGWLKLWYNSNSKKKYLHNPSYVISYEFDKRVH